METTELADSNYIFNSL